MDLLLVGGVSGSGKSVAMGALEDSGYYAINNLPTPLAAPLAAYLRDARHDRVAISLDVKTAESIDALPRALAELRAQGWTVRFLYLDAKTDTLVKRFSETRRRHPLSREDRTLQEAILVERQMLAELATLGYHVDTSDLSAHALRGWIKDFISIDAARMTLLFQSFGFKHGVPLDADLVFDVRCLPNPHYEPRLTSLTGKDEPVITFLQAHPEVERMFEEIRGYLERWLPAYARDNRNYLTVAIGCTGGKHRSVYLVERLGGIFAASYQTLRRHRELA
jgi:UPF0042 nucleotide-binding protein